MGDSMKVKICGITRSIDAGAAVAAGADALGFMFYAPSKRNVDIASAAAIIRDLPPFITRVGVFVNPNRNEVEEAVERAGINCLQFHGEESPDFIAGFHLPVIKAFRIKDRESLKLLGEYRGVAAWLLDSYSPGAHGGTGHRFNWDLAVEAREMGHPIILAGGLTPDNIRQAVTATSPYGVDVSSGVEVLPGIKDPDSIAAFIRNARED